MEIRSKLIGYGGVTQDGNDYASKDGELAVCQGVVNEDGGLRKLVQGADIGLNLLEGECVYLHRNVGMGKHYIVLRNDNLQGNVLDWYNEDLTLGGAGFLVLGTEEYAEAAAIGNMLIVTTGERKYYCLWKENSYLILGNDLPEIDVEFTSQGYYNENRECYPDDGGQSEYSWIKTISAQEGYRSLLLSKVKSRPQEIEWHTLGASIKDYFDWSGGWSTRTTLNVKEDDSADSGKNYPQLFTDKCLYALNSVIAEAKAQGLFVMPRLIRAAWRLYDGTYAKFTTPVLVFNSGTRHMLACNGWDVSDNGSKKIAAQIYPYTLDYFIKNTLTGANGLIAKWGDLIKGVTFFASSEVYDYDQQGTVRELRKLYITTGTINSTTYMYANLPRVNEEDQIAQLRSGGPFYKLYDRDLEEVSGKYVLLQFKRALDNDGNPLPIVAHNLNFGFTYNGSTSGAQVQLEIKQRDSMDSICERLREAIRNKGWKVEVHMMYRPKSRNEDELYDSEIGIALVPKGSATLSLEDINDQEGSTAILSLFTYGYNCYGCPLPSDVMPIKTLETQTHVNDDYLQHVELLPRVMDAYNDRLNMGNLKVAFKEYKLTLNSAGIPTQNVSASGYGVKKVWFYIKTDKGDKIVSSTDTRDWRSAMIHYLYYPDKRCYKAVVKYYPQYHETNAYYLSLPMKPSDTLNGAVFADKIPYYEVAFHDNTNTFSWEAHFYKELDSYKIASFDESAIASVENTGEEELKNVVLVTMVNNPLNWEAKGESSVGNGEIMALAPNTRALSEGQFGQHPMYAFTTDEGVWAMQIGSDGQLVAVQAVTRDTLTDKKSILQLDTSILFGTERGIMELAGAKSACMTDKLTGKGFDVTQLTGYATLLDAAGMTLDKLPSKDADFRQFVRGCRMAYDYVNQRIYVWNPKEEDSSREYNYAYVYSIKGKSWGVIGCTLKEPLNTYPETLVTTDDRKVVKLGATTDPSAASSTSPNLGAEQNVGKALIVTRPLKVDSLDGLKTLYEVWQRGMIRPADSTHWVKQALYGSRDMYNWRLVGSSESSRMPSLGGSPYKYFRVAVVASIGDDEFIEGCEIRWRDKYNKSLR